MLFQKLCQCKSNWDEVILKELDGEWKLLVLDLISTISLPISFFCELSDPTVSATLCGFCDASYGAVVYLVLKTETRSSTQFVAAKTRVAPLQSQTIPFVISTPPLETHCFCTLQSAAPDPISEHKMLYGFPGGSLLDYRK